MPESVPRPDGWGLVRVKREWVPGWLWRCFCVGPKSWRLVLLSPFKELLTKRAS